MCDRDLLRLFPLMLLMTFQAKFANGLSIRFYSEVKVSTPFIQLGDIAEITGGTPETIATYEAAKLAPSPPAGGQSILDFDSIRNRMIALGYSTGELEFAGQSRVVVNGPGNPSSGRSKSADPVSSQNTSNPSPATNPQMLQAERIVLGAVRNVLAKSLEPSEFALAEIQIRIRPSDGLAIQGTSSSDWIVAGWSPRLEEPHHLVLSKKQPSRWMESVRVTCEVKMPPRTLTVKQLLPAGHVIAASDLDWVYSHHAEGETRIDEIVGMETMRALRPGMPIPMNDLRKKPYVRARDLVSVHARQGAITVKQPMRALGTGGLGEAVTFVTLDGKERFTARITGYHEAEVIETYAPVNP